MAGASQSRSAPAGVSPQAFSAVGFGYPTPGPQNPTATDVLTSQYFVTNYEWKQYLNGNSQFDYIVIGSGFTGTAFVDQIYKLNSNARILMLERGGFFLPTHFQMLPLSFKDTLGGESETFPWTLSKKTTETALKYVHGSCPFIGGRSCFWSAWCPQPKPELMRGWEKTAKELITISETEAGFWEDATEFLHVVEAKDINDQIFGKLQTDLEVRLRQNQAMIVSLDKEDTLNFPSAKLAVGESDLGALKFNKYSTPGPLFDIYFKQRNLSKQGNGAALKIVERCVAERFLSDGTGFATAIQTSQGNLPVGDAKVILATGCIPPATMLLNSFPELPRLHASIGTRVTGHFLSHITARVKRDAFDGCSKFCRNNDLEIGALYVPGKDAASGLQYHIQITAIADNNPKRNAKLAARECPDYAAAATEEQLVGSEEYVVFVCAALGETDENNSESWLRKNESTVDVTTNVTLQILPNGADKKLWDLMEEATYEAIKAMASKSADEPVEIEYWHDTPSGPGQPAFENWQVKTPSKDQNRVPGLVHEAGTLFMGKQGKQAASDGASLPAAPSVGADFRPHGVENVYLTGASIFPTSGSWNPTLTMVGFAQHLAKRLEGENAEAKDAFGFCGRHFAKFHLAGNVQLPGGLPAYRK